MSAGAFLWTGRILALPVLPFNAKIRHLRTPIGEIGPLCGYEDETYFKNLFRQSYGVSMRQLRAQIRAGRVATSRGLR